MVTKVDVKKTFTRLTASNGLDKFFFVTRMLTRDLFAVANLLDDNVNIVELPGLNAA